MIYVLGVAVVLAMAFVWLYMSAIDDNKTLTSQGISLYNLINKNYSQMWG